MEFWQQSLPAIYWEGFQSFSTLGTRMKTDSGIPWKHEHLKVEMNVIIFDQTRRQLKLTGRPWWSPGRLQLNETVDAALEVLPS